MAEFKFSTDPSDENAEFQCSNCDNSLVGARYVLNGEKPHEKPYCLRCFDDILANDCERCGEKIGVDEKDLSYDDKHWHDRCFTCDGNCDGKSLIGQPFAYKDGKLYGEDCYDELFAPHCNKCDEIFKTGMKKYAYKSDEFHEHCFTCDNCDTEIKTDPFVPLANKFWCEPCFIENKAPRCTKCGEPISKGGVTYKNQPFHREHFTCSNENCEKPLAGEKFTSKDDKPYCLECYGDMFAKPCQRCENPILAVGGSKFVGFDDKYWHSDCFNCPVGENCDHKSLVGQGFFVQNDDIVCPECRA